jgi:hypothetical protein
MRTIILFIFINVAWCDSLDNEIIKDLDFFQQIDIVKEDAQVPLDVLAQLFSNEKISKEDQIADDALELKK